MKKLLEISLGVVTSVGGFLEMGSLSTAAQGGAAFRFQLVWPIVLGTLCILFLTEMAGRFAAVSQHTIAAGIRDRFGIRLFMLPFLATPDWSGRHSHRRDFSIGTDLLHGMPVVRCKMSCT
jgi:hypothetical protein